MVVGAGFLVSATHVCTCAHVVAAALGTAPDAESPPEGLVSLDFPLLVGAEATAEVTSWLPVRDDDTGDLALLRLTDTPPETARPARLAGAEDLWGHRIRVFGFPKGRPDGVWVEGRLRGRQGTGWLQMEALTPGPVVQQGFSGSPVWDEELRAVVGLTVTTESGSSTAYLLPSERIRLLWPDAGGCPYRGLAAFQEAGAPLFHGRERDIE